MMIHPMKKPIKKGSPVLKIVILLVAVLIALKKFKIFPFKK